MTMTKTTTTTTTSTTSSSSSRPLLKKYPRGMQHAVVDDDVGEWPFLSPSDVFMVSSNNSSNNRSSSNTSTSGASTTTTTTTNTSNIIRVRLDHVQPTTRMGIISITAAEDNTTNTVVLEEGPSTSFAIIDPTLGFGRGSLVLFTLLTGGPIQVISSSASSSPSSSSSPSCRNETKTELKVGDSRFISTTSTSNTTSSCCSTTTKSSIHHDDENHREEWYIILKNHQKEDDATTTTTTTTLILFYEFNADGFFGSFCSTENNRHDDDDDESTVGSWSPTIRKTYYSTRSSIGKGQEEQLEDWPFTNPKSNYVIHSSSNSSNNTTTSSSPPPIMKASGRIDHSTPTTRTGIWHCTKGTMECTEQGDEFMTILSGRVEVTDVETGQVVSLGPGDSMFIHNTSHDEGKRVIWNVLEDVSKVFFGFKEGGYS